MPTRGGAGGLLLGLAALTSAVAGLIRSINLNATWAVPSGVNEPSQGSGPTQACLVIEINWPAKRGVGQQALPR